MKFTPADIAAMIDAVGTDIATDFDTMRGHFMEAGKLMPNFNGDIVTTGPMLTLSEADAANITENETAITINGTLYQATQKIPDGAGFVELELTKDY